MVPSAIGSLLTDYVERTVAALAAADRAVARVVTVAPGTTPAWDGACGQLYARLVSIVPGVDQTLRGAASVRCGVHFWTVTAAIAIVRCVAVVDNNGNAPDPARVAEDGFVMLADAADLEQVLICSPYTRSIVSGTPLPEQGGYSGFEWSFTLRVPVCKDCE